MLYFCIYYNVKTYFLSFYSVIKKNFMKIFQNFSCQIIQFCYMDTVKYNDWNEFSITLYKRHHIKQCYYYILKSNYK